MEKIPNGTKVLHRVYQRDKRGPANNRTTTLVLDKYYEATVIGYSPTGKSIIIMFKNGQTKRVTRNTLTLKEK